MVPVTSRPSQNLGNLSPGTNNLSTPSSVITHMRITPPDEPSRDMASARAIAKDQKFVLQGTKVGNILFFTNSMVSSRPQPSL